MIMAMIQVINPANLDAATPSFYPINMARTGLISSYHIFVNSFLP
jgi:hypothetical protein